MMIFQKFIFNIFMFSTLFYCKQVEKQKKGHKGNYKVWRVNTFYPTVLLTELMDVKNNFEKKVISENLSVFVRK